MKSVNLLLLVIAVPVLMSGLCSPDKGPDFPDHPNTAEYFTWRMPGGNNMNLTNPPDSVVFATYPGHFNVIVAYNATNSINSYISYYGPLTAGTYTAAQVSLYNNGHFFVSKNNPVHITINSFGTTGQPITGSYAGTLKDSVGTGTYSATGNFKITNPY